MSRISTTVIVLIFLMLAASSTVRVLSAPLAQAPVTGTSVLPPQPPPAKVTPTPTLGIKPGPGDRTYTVAAGDNPWQIATKMYGNGFFYKYILDANRLTESSILQVGMVLVIPPLPAATAPAAKQTVTTTVTLTATVAASPSVPASLPVTPTLNVTVTLVATSPVTPGVAALSTGPGATPSRASSEAYAITTQTTAEPVTRATSARDPLTAILTQAASYPEMAAILDALGWLCAIGSLVCAWQSYQTYHRVRILRRMMIMSARARARL